ncbi:hypothetical protein DTL42_18475 [Bremerella cremea]|uniref:Phage abortive infection protein n=1 Tax=Bremerella cremea TaxID=1031537 RepID=A0A368KRB5_9BACT|nr:putative phage abortive infection protein [Bremerella cremea]RCS43971.1 hypothetical protein DTL42_18475 [Bremerella cremea]
MTSDQLNDQNRDHEPDWFKYGWQISLVVIAAFVILAGLQFTMIATVQWLFERDDITAFGISGDFFGAINALFSALAFAAIIITLWMQKYELSQQREELEMTRGVMVQQQQEMREQNELLGKQRFETTFFRMLELHGQVVETLRTTDNANFGRSVVDDMVESILRFVYANEGDPGLTVESSISAYEQWYQRNESAIGHYFRTLYNILSFVSDQQIKDEKTYTRLVRAQLSSSELQLLMFNALGRRGRDKFKPLIEKYTILKHLPQDDILDLLRPEFKPTAFESMDNSSNE